MKYKNNSVIISARLLSVANDVEELMLYVHTVFESLDMSKQKSFQMEVCIAEALNNIIEHAYSLNPCHKIRIIIKITDSQLRVVLFDTGSGYILPDTEISNIEEENGRGWFILQNWTDSIYYQRYGRINRLTLVYTLDAVTLQKAITFKQVS